MKSSAIALPATEIATTAAAKAVGAGAAEHRVAGSLGEIGGLVAWSPRNEEDHRRVVSDVGSGHGGDTEGERPRELSPRVPHLARHAARFPESSEGKENPHEAEAEGFSHGRRAGAAGGEGNEVRPASRSEREGADDDRARARTLNAVRTFRTRARRSSPPC